MSGTIITTIKQNCRRCYTCVRDCPAQAIRIEDGQAFVVDERCIACGNCTLVCSQNAKAYLSGLEQASWMLEEDAPVAALLAPSFPAGFDVPAGQVVGAFKAAGFDHVVEVAQGADLVSRAYAEYLEANPTGVHIATACPAVAEYVRKYHPEMVDRLVPIVSPMIATALAVKELYGDEVRCVFIGPCVAKKAEARDPQLPPVIDEVLTLQEAHRLLAARGVDPAKAAEAEWDAPAAGRARVFPLPGGLLDAAGMDRGMLDPDVLVVSGHDETVEVLDSLSEADTGQTLLVEALMCRGCYCGPGISSSEPGLLRKRRVGEYVADCRRLEAEAAAVSAAGEAEDDRLAESFPGLVLSRCVHARRPAAARADRGRDPRHPREDQQVLPRGRAELRRLRLPDLPRQGGRRVLRHGRGRHVPAVHDRPGRAGLRRAQRAVERDARRAPSHHQHGEAGQHGPDGRRRRPRAQQPAQHDPPVHAHPREEAQGPRRPGPRPQPRRRGERALQEDRRQPARLRAAEPRARRERLRARRRAAGGRLRRRRRRSRPGTPSTSWSTWSPASAPTSTATR